MSYSEKTAIYRAELVRCVNAGNADGAMNAAILYGKLLREMAERLSSYRDKAVVKAEADKYDLIAAMILKYGVSDSVRRAVFTGELPELKKSSKGATEMPTPQTQAAPPPVAADGAEWSADMFERYRSATLVVTTEDGIGTGFFISNDGLFLTNHHVIHTGSSRNRNITVETGDGKQRYRAEYLNCDKGRDLALLRAVGIKGSVPFIPLIRDYSLVRPGTDMMLIGNGLDFGLAPIAGTVKFARARGHNDLVYTAPCNNGDSGAPVINRHGECIGIHKSSTEAQIRGTVEIKAKGIANATPAEDITLLLTKWGVKL